MNNLILILSMIGAVGSGVSGYYVCSIIICVAGMAFCLVLIGKRDGWLYLALLAVLPAILLATPAMAQQADTKDVGIKASSFSMLVIMSGGSSLQILGGTNCDGSWDVTTCDNQYVALLMVDGKEVGRIPMSAIPSADRDRMRIHIEAMAKREWVR